MRVWLVAGAIIAILGGGAALVAVKLAGDEAGAAAVVPVDALAYAHATLDPSLDQKRALASLAKRLPEDAQDQLEKSIPKALDDLLGEADLDFDKDIKPWLGGEVAVFLAGADIEEPDFAALVESTDTEMTLEVVRRTVTEELGEPKDSTHREVTYSVIPQDPDAPADEPEASYAVVGNFLVAGTTTGVKGAIDASVEGGLEANASYSELVGQLTPERIVTYWADTPKLFETMMATVPEAQRDQFTRSPLFTQQQPSAGALLATEDSIVFESVSNKPSDEGLFQAMPSDRALLATAPEDTWFSLVVPGVGKNLEGLVDSLPPDAGLDDIEQQFADATGLDLRDDVLSWMEDGSLFVSGDAVQQLAGALVIRSNDAEATSTFLQRVVDLGIEQGGAVRPVEAGGLEGFELADGSVPVGVTALGGDRLILAIDSPEVSEEDSAVAGATGEGPTLAESAAFTRATTALGEEYAPVFYLDVAGAVRVFKSAFGASSAPPEFTQAEPYIEPISSVIAGTVEEGDHLKQRLVIGTTD